MKKLLLIMGDLAAGKTTLANKLADRYKIVAFNKDEFKEVIANTYSFKTREESRQISILAVESMINIFTHFAMVEKPLILESNFHQDEIIKINELANKYGYDVLTLLVKADISLLHSRFVNRADNENRHPVHCSEVFKNFDDFKKYIEFQRKELPLGKVINVDATNFNYQEDEKLLSAIDKFIYNNGN